MFTVAPRPFAPQSILLSALAAIALFTTGCKDDSGPGKLFDEDGTWELTSYALSGTGIEQISRSRQKRFLMKFDAENQVVQTAMCSNNDRHGPTDSECDGFTDSMWICSCFGYDFEEDQMAWLEFEPGATPPMVDVGEEPDAGGDEAGGDTDTDTETETAGGSGGDEGAAETGDPDDAPRADGALQITVSERAEVGATFDFSPLPAGVFGSDGVSSRFTFQKKAASVFDVVLEDPDRPTCQPCI